MFLRGVRNEIEFIERTMPEAAAVAKRVMAVAAAGHACRQEADVAQEERRVAGAPRQGWPRRRRSPSPRRRSPSPARGRSQGRGGSPQLSPRSCVGGSPRWVATRRSRSPAHAGGPFWDPVWQLEWDCAQRLRAAEGPLPLQQLLKSVEWPRQVFAASPGATCLRQQQRQQEQQQQREQQQRQQHAGMLSRSSWRGSSACSHAKHSQSPRRPACACHLQGACPASWLAAPSFSTCSKAAAASCQCRCCPAQRIG